MVNSRARRSIDVHRPVIQTPRCGEGGVQVRRENPGLEAPRCVIRGLQRFVEGAKSWLHVDIYGWTPVAKPARPEGGECQAARAIFKLLGERYG